MSEPFIAEIKIFAGNFAPRGWAFCDGNLIQIANNPALFSLVGTTFGGDGRSTFGLPNLRDRSPMGVGTGAGLSPRQWGQRGGVSTVTLNEAQIPAHQHLLGKAGRPIDDDAAGHSLATARAAHLYAEANPDGTMAGGSLTSTGGNQAHDNRQPYLGLYFIIALVGVFPQRN